MTFNPPADPPDYGTHPHLNLLGARGATGGKCKIKMLWNWYTTDACFLSSSWQIAGPGMFAGTCVGVVCLGITLEFLRRCARAYERYLAGRAADAAANLPTVAELRLPGVAPPPKDKQQAVAVANSHVHTRPATFRPSFLQQLIRAILYVLQFANAYILMLLAMYYNGWIIICILIGVFIGFFAFQWETLSSAGGNGASAHINGDCCG